MKIGLLTLPICENYGGILQCVALHSYLKKQGHDVVMLYKVNDELLWKLIVKKILLFIPFQDFRHLRSTNKRRLLHLPFINRHIPKRSKKLINTNDLKDSLKRYGCEAVIVGSDQVWRLDYISDKYYKSFFLDFVDDDIKKIAYAASFGKDHWQGANDQAEIGMLLDRFDYISVREKSGIDVCKNTFNTKKDVFHVLDPTMLWSKDFYVSLITSNTFDKKISLLTYVLDEEKNKKNIISACIKSSAATPENVLHLKGFGDKKRCYTVPEWLEAFSKANFIVTDSFHGVVFSIIFNKQFVAIANKDRGLDRFVSLLDMFNLSSRLIFDDDNYSQCLTSEINYDEVNQKIAENKEISLAYLKTL